MGDTMDHTLINPNQLRHYGTKVRDDPTSNHPLSIITESNEFCMGLQMAGTICYAETHSPTAQELENCPHIQLSSEFSWNPHKVRFPSCKRSLEEVMGGLRTVSTLSVLEEYAEEEYNCIFSLDKLTRRISGMTTVSPGTSILMPKRCRQHRCTSHEHIQ